MMNIKMKDTPVQQNNVQPTTAQKLSPKITVIGVGGAGGNAVNNMIESNLDGCEFLVCNADAQALENSRCTNRIQLGPNVTGGLGAGSKPAVGRSAAEETLDEVLKHLEGSNMAFVTAGMGGGTGTGAAPVIAKACREKGILTVGVVTKPFHFEGSHRMAQADAGIEEMQEYVDTLIVIPNQNLFRIADEKTTFADAFKMADEVLQSGVRGVTDLMVRPGLVNLDFADIRTAMLEMGKAMMGTGEAEGEKRAIQAAESAINNPLLDDVSMKGAHGVIINVTGGYDMTLFEADEACNRIRDEVDGNANIIFGATFDQSMEGRMRVSIVATGIEKEAMAGTVRPAGTTSTTFTGNDGGGGGGGLNRTQPMTSTEADATSSVSVADAAAAQAAMQNIAAPMREAASAPADAVETASDADMFDQARYGAAETSEQSDEVAETMRGTRVNDSFIPPAPIEAKAYNPEVAAAPVESQPAAPAPITATAPSYRAASTGAASGSSLQLNPPKLPAEGEKKKSQSLFERLTGSVQQHLEQLRESDDIAASTEAPASLQKTATPTAPAQQSLNMDAPSKPKAADDQLDIPAFLRRQAN